MNKYKVVTKETIEDINSEVTLLNHVKSGARVLLIENDDENKVFSIAFRTPPMNDTGIPHIIEHSVLCGSRKYPVKEPFVDIMKGSLNTFLNAFTSADKTTYPVASCNEKDFDNLCDVYMDAVLYPNIYKNNEIFLQEGWHYELPAVDSKVFYNGVVYNEMRGAYSTSERVLMSEIQRVMYSDNCYKYESGGHPDAIINLTRQQFLDFHKKYYHPSNSYIMIYGNFKADKKLEWLDNEYLSNFEKIELDSTIADQPLWDRMKKTVVDYPIGAEQDMNNKTSLSYNYLVGNALDSKLWMTMNILSYVLLSAPGAKLKQALLEKGIGNDISPIYYDSIKQPLFTIMAQNANYEQLDEFIKTIEETLQSIVDEKINKELLLGAINVLEFKYREADFGNFPKGLVYCMNIMDTWLYDENGFSLRLHTSKLFEELKSLIGTDYFEEVIRKYFISNTSKSVVVTKPNKELASQKEAALRARLDEYQNKLDAAELEALVEDTNKLKIYQASEDTREDKATIPMLSRSDLKVEPAQYHNDLEEVAGVKVLNHNIFTNEIGYLNLLFDIKGLDASLLPYVSILKDVLGKINTCNYSYQDLNNKINISSGGISFTCQPLPVKNDFKLHFKVESSVLYDNIDFVFTMIDEIINNTLLDDEARLLEIVSEKYAYMQMYLNNAGHICSAYRAEAYVDPTFLCRDQISNIGYFQTLEKLVTDYANHKDNLKATLKKLVTHIFRQDNLLVSYTATKVGYDLMKSNLSTFVKTLKGKKVFEDTFKFEVNKLNEGFKTPFDVQYVALAGNYIDKGLKYTGAIRVLNNILATGYLWTNIRVKGGAYGGMCNFTKIGGFFTSYRDPNLGATLKIYQEVIDYVKSFVADEEEMTKAIIGTIGSIDRPLTPQDNGRRSLNAYLTDQTYEELVKERKEVIGCTVADIVALAPYVEAIINDQAICVIGNEKKINSEKDIFQNVVNLFK